MGRPELKRVPEFFHRYIAQVQGEDLLPAMELHSKHFATFLDSIPAVKHDYRYDHDKWTIKEVLQHIIDAERIFSYRALCIARKEKAGLPLFDEDAYAANSKASQRNWEDLINEFRAVRQTTEMLFRSFDDEQLQSDGTVSGKPTYVLGLGFILIGHAAHHENVLKERYLK